MKVTFNEILHRHPNTTSYDFIRYLKDYTVQLLNNLEDIKRRTLSVAYLATDRVFSYNDLKVNEIKIFLDLEDLAYSTVAADLSELTKKAKYNDLTNDDRILVRKYILKVLTLNEIIKGEERYESSNKKVLRSTD